MSTSTSDLLSPAAYQPRIDQLIHVDRPRYRRLWAYYENAMRSSAVAAGDSGSDRPYRQMQEWGLPSRITGLRAGAEIDAAQVIDDVARKEVVIENDIGWRIETMVDYLFGKPLVIESAAPDPDRRRIIGQLLRLILAHNGGILFFQQLALLGSVYGFIDVLVKFDAAQASSAGPSPTQPDAGCATRDLGSAPACDEPSGDAAGESPGPPPTGPASREDEPRNPGASNPSLDERLPFIARMIRLEIVEPARALPVFSPDDYRALDAYAQCYTVERDGERVARIPAGWFNRFRASLLGLRDLSIQSETRQPLVLDVVTAEGWRRYEDGKLIADGCNSLGQIPLVHIQNTSVPFRYSGGSDVEPLIPLQDELNTRLSDRAHRITLQSFKMYLGKGIENFNSLPVAPGRMWATDNESADVLEFGGDAHCPSEEGHIADVREAMDKTSGVTPIAAGAIKGRIGRLTSAAALRITMLALLAKTEKKRTTYGSAIARMCELALAWLDKAGLFATSPEERGVEINWPSPLPENELEKLQEAVAKARLGVPRETLLRELGY